MARNNRENDKGDKAVTEDEEIMDWEIAVYDDENRKLKRHIEHLMKFPQNHHIYCEFRDRECGFECEPKYHGAWGDEE